MMFLIEFDPFYRFHGNPYNMYSLHKERSECSSIVSFLAKYIYSSNTFSLFLTSYCQFPVYFVNRRFKLR